MAVFVEDLRVFAPHPGPDGVRTQGRGFVGTLDERLDAAESAVGVTFTNRELLRLALVHRSWLNEHDETVDVATASNERLEFLGDAVLGMICAEWVYEHYPLLAEGDLTSRRVALVRTETLAVWAEQLGLGRLTLLARGELGPGGDLRPRVLAGVFEAMIGAIYLDQGVERARDFVRALLHTHAPRIIDDNHTINYKGRLQELIQERERATPGYRTISASGPAHERVFVIEAVLRGETLGTGSGSNKRAAEQDAARDALERLAQEGITEAHGRTV